MTLPVTAEDWEKLIASLPVNKNKEEYDSGVDYIIANLKKGMTNRDVSHLLSEALSISISISISNNLVYKNGKVIKP